MDLYAQIVPEAQRPGSRADDGHGQRPGAEGSRQAEHSGELEISIGT